MRGTLENILNTS